jgi:hypothetical protein
MTRVFVYLCIALSLSILLGSCDNTPTGQGPSTQVSPPDGEVKPGTIVTLTSSASAQIFYTLDETRPDLDKGIRYTGPFAIWSPTILRFVAVDAEGRVGPVGQARYVVDATLPQTTVTPPSGNFREAIRVRFQTDPDTTVYYTTNGTEPTLQTATRYTGPFALSTDTTLFFFGVDASGNREILQKATYNFPPKLTLQPKGGLYWRDQLTVTLTSNQPAGLEVRQIDGSPNPPFLPYTMPIAFDQDRRIIGFAVDDQFASTQIVDEYALARPMTQQSTTVAALSPLASVIIDIEGLDRPVWHMALADRLVRLAPSTNGEWDGPVALATLSFRTAWMRSWDLDGDGLNDFLLGDTNGKLHIFRAKTATSLQPDNDLLSPWKASDVQLVTAVPLDYNGDGLLDIFLLDKRTNQSRLLQQTTQGYIVQSAFKASIAAGAVGALAGDLDRDGLPDLLILPGGHAKPYILYGNKQGQFPKQALAEHLTGPDEGVQWLQAARTDVDLDGDLDLVLVGVGTIPKHTQSNGPTPQSKGIHVVVLTHLVGREWKRSHSIYLSGRTIQNLQVADADRDGYDDLLIQRSSNDIPIVLKNTLGLRWFVRPPTSSTNWPSSRQLMTGDFGENGRAQLAFLTPTNKLASFVHPDTSSTFLKPVLQGIRGNRNAIGTKLRWRTTTFFSRIREAGVRTTGPNQGPLLPPIHFRDSSQVGTMTLIWPDGQQREFTSPTTNKRFFIAPN